MRPSIIWAAIVAASLLATPVFGASKKDWNDCGADDPDRSIAGCTRILNAGGETQPSRTAADASPESSTAS